MDKFKGKYEIILGFVTLIVSLSAFKEELSEIIIDLGFTTISFSQYFLYCIIGFSLCLYFYVVEFISRETKFGHWKIFDYLIVLAYSIFVVIIISPLLLILNFLLNSIYTYITAKPKELRKDYLSSVYSLLISR